jgi:hypothetical protein
MTPWHLGSLHPVEQALTIVLAFGPFLLLGIVVAVRRRQDARDEAAEGAAARESAERDAADRSPDS